VTFDRPHPSPPSVAILAANRASCSDKGQQMHRNSNLVHTFASSSNSTLINVKKPTMLFTEAIVASET